MYVFFSVFHYESWCVSLSSRRVVVHFYFYRLPSISLISSVVSQTCYATPFLLFPPQYMFDVFWYCRRVLWFRHAHVSQIRLHQSQKCRRSLSIFQPMRFREGRTVWAGYSVGKCPIALHSHRGVVGDFEICMWLSASQPSWGPCLCHLVEDVWGLGKITVPKEFSFRFSSPVRVQVVQEYWKTWRTSTRKTETFA